MPSAKEADQLRQPVPKDDFPEAFKNYFRLDRLPVETNWISETREFI